MKTETTRWGWIANGTPCAETFDTIDAAMKHMQHKWDCGETMESLEERRWHLARVKVTVEAVMVLRGPGSKLKHD